MAKRLYTRLALTAATVLFFAAPAMAQRPLGFDQLPKSGVVNYQGTLTSTDFSTPIQFTVDFSAGTLAASLTIPLLANGEFSAGPQGLGLHANIDTQGGFLAWTNNFFVQEQAALFLAGNFFGGGAKEVAGTFVLQLCNNATTELCPQNPLTRLGSFDARAP